jgi:hypothetical protein
MPSFEVAHIRQQGIDLIVVPLDHSFRVKTQSEQHAVVNELQLRSNAAGLAGTVVPVWDNGGGRMAFIAPQPWHPFFRSMSLGAVWNNVNRQVSW